MTFQQRVSTFFMKIRDFLLKNFVLTHKKRVNLYRNLEMITGSGISLNETVRLLSRKYRKHMPHSFLPLVLDEWLKTMAMGRTFYEAIARWVPSWELLLLRTSSTSQITTTFKNVADLSSNIIKLKSGLVGAIRYPLFAMIMLLVLMSVFAYYVIPQLVSFLPPEKWPPITKNLYDFTLFFTGNLLSILIGVIIIVTGIGMSLSRLPASFLRNILNYLPPWSIYKQFHGSIFLLSLASLIHSGVSFGQCLETIRIGSGPYLSSLLIRMQAKLQAGRSAGEAIQCELFDKETLVNLEVYADADKLEEGITVLAQEQLETQIVKLADAAKLLGNMILLIVVLFILWNYMGLIALQSSISG